MPDEVAPWDSPAPEAKKPARQSPKTAPAEVAPWEAGAQDKFLANARKKETWPQFAGKMTHEAAMGIPFADRIAAGAQSLMGRGPYARNLENIRGHSAQYEKEK